jgi:hypothetical protein
MSPLKRVAAVVVPAALVIGGVAYGVSHQGSSDDETVGECTTKVGRLRVVVTGAQARNAALISGISIRRGMPAHAATIALATALQESKLYNLRGGDRDSLGLFQQRPSQGWGTPQQILDPVHATNAFYDALVRVDGYQTLPVTEAAQEVQRSGFPEAYAVYESDARALASALTGFSPAAFWCHVPDPSASAKPAARRAVAVRRALAPAFGPVGVSVATGSHVQVDVATRPHGWAVASYLVTRAHALGITSVTYAGRAWDAGSSSGWHGIEGDRNTSAVVVD